MDDRNWFDAALCYLHRIELILLAMLLISMVVIATAQIVLRNFFDMGLLWADPLLRVMLLWLGLLGAVAASHDNKHISIDLLSKLVPDKFLPRIRMITSLFTAIVCAIVAYHAGRFVLDEYNYHTPSSVSYDIPAWTLELIIPLGFALIALRYFLLIGRYWLRKPISAENR